MGVGVHARRDADQDVRRSAGAAGVQVIEAVELVEAVDDDVAHAGVEGRAQLVEALVVAVHRARRRRHAGGEHDVQLAPAGDVEEHALLVRQAGHRPAQERLRRVDRAPGAERFDGLAAPRPQVSFVVDEDRRPVGGGELVDAAAADDQAPVGGHRRRIRQEVAREWVAHWRPRLRPAQIAKPLWYLAAPSGIMSTEITDETQRGGAPRCS